MNISTAVSIIIPIYNAEQTLLRCVESVLGQICGDFEVILIDDGSTDSSPKICDRIAAEDSRVTCLHTPNGGVSSARNYGLALARGERVMFVDSDDYIEPEMVGDLLHVALSTGADLVCSLGIDEAEEGTVLTPYYCSPSQVEVIPKERISFLEDYAAGVVWGILFKRAIINGLSFSGEYSVGEDSVFFAEALVRSGSLAFIPGRYYHYVIRDNSLSHSPFKEESFAEFLAWKRACELARDDGRLCRTAQGRAGLVATKILTNSGGGKLLSRHQFVECSQMVRLGLGAVLASGVPLKRKILQLVVALAPRAVTGLNARRLAGHAPGEGRAEARRGRLKAH